jgi:Zn finger protein HypA/HybF involved in hydrogenase expression
VHEVSLVEELAQAVAERAAGRPVAMVRVRRATTIPPDVLRFAWELVTRDGPLEGIELSDESYEIRLACGCGWAGILGHDDVVGPGRAVCPGCDGLRAIEHTAELELVEVRVREPAAT